MSLTIKATALSNAIQIEYSASASEIQFKLYRGTSLEDGFLEQQKTVKNSSGFITLPAPHAGEYFLRAAEFINTIEQTPVTTNILKSEGARAATTSNRYARAGIPQSELVAPDYNTNNYSDQCLSYSFDANTPISSSETAIFSNITLEGSDSPASSGFSTVLVLSNGNTNNITGHGVIDCRVNRKKYYRLKCQLSTTINGASTVETHYTPVVKSVLDTTPPSLCVGSTRELQQNGTFTDYATATDNNGSSAKLTGNELLSVPANSLTITATGTVNTATPGTYQRTYTATDAAGNVTTETINVVITSTEPPPWNPILEVQCSEELYIGDTFAEQAAATGYGAGVSAEFVDGVLTKSEGGLTITATGTVNTNVAGTYMRTYTATDADGRTTTVTKTIVVNKRVNDPPKPPDNPQEGLSWKVTCLQQDDNTGNQFVIEWHNADLTGIGSVEIGYRDKTAPPQKHSGWTTRQPDYPTTTPVNNSGVSGTFAVNETDGSYTLKIQRPGIFEIFLSDAKTELNETFHCLHGYRTPCITLNEAYETYQDENFNVTSTLRCKTLRIDPEKNWDQQARIELTSDLINWQSYDINGETRYQQEGQCFIWDVQNQNYYRMDPDIHSPYILKLWEKDGVDIPDTVIIRVVDINNGEESYSSCSFGGSSFAPVERPKLVLKGNAFVSFNSVDGFNSWTDPGVTVVNPVTLGDLSTSEEVVITNLDNYTTRVTKTITYNYSYIWEGDMAEIATVTRVVEYYEIDEQNVGEQWATRRLQGGYEHDLFHLNGTADGIEITNDTHEYQSLQRVSIGTTGRLNDANYLYLTGYETVIDRTVAPNTLYCYDAFDTTDTGNVEYYIHREVGLLLDGATVRATASGALIQWPAIDAAESYTVYRSVEGLAWNPIQSDITGTSFTDTTAQNNIDYWYAIGASVTLPQHQTGITGVGETVTHNSNPSYAGRVTLREQRPVFWTDSSPTTGQSWYRAIITDGSETATTNYDDVAIGESVTWTDENPTTGQSWYRATVTDGSDSAITNYDDVTIADPNAPDPPTITLNPATANYQLSVGDTFTPPTVTAVDYQNTSLTPVIKVNGTTVETISLDTSSSTGYVITYTATDSGNRTTTKTVTVSVEEEPEDPQPVQLAAPTITVTPHARYVEVAVTPVVNAVNYTLMSSGTSTFEANRTHYAPDNTTGPYRIPFTPQTTIYIKAMALGDTTNYTNSEWGEAVSTTTLSLTPLNYPVVTWSNGAPTFLPVTGATAYRIRYHATDAALATTSNWLTLVSGTKPAGLPDGTWNIQSSSIADNENDYSDSPWGDTQTVTITSPENPVTNYFFIDGDNLKYLGNTPAGWYKVRVRSTDQNGGYYERDKYVRITPNSNPTDILLDNHVAHVSPSNARMGGLTTLDPDTSDTHTYSIVSETEVDADTTIPVLTLLGESNVQILKDSVWTDPGVTATDNYDDNISDNVVVTGTVNTGIAGTYVLTYSVTDFAGNAATTVNRTVVVRNADDILDSIPVIVLNGNSTVYLTKGSTWTDPGAVATDDNDGDITPQISVTGTVNTQTVGSYALTYNVSDSSGNAAFPVTRTVMVIEQEDLPDVPSLTLTGSSTVYHPKGLTWTDPGAAATDSDNTDLTSSIVVSGTVNVNVVGTYTLTYSVTNSSNVTVRQTRTVIVENTADFDAVAISNSVIRITLPTATLQQVWLRRRVYNPQGEWATILNGTAAKTFDDSTADSNGPSPNIVYEYQYSIDGTNWTGSENAWLTDVIHYGAITEVYGNTNSELNLLKVGDSGVFYARIFNVLTGTPIVPEDISSITYTVQKRSMSLRTVTWTNVTNFTNVSVPVFPTILESCIMTDLWTADSQGFNFVHSPDTRTTDLFTTEGVYRVQYRLVPVSGNPVNLVFTVLVE